MSSLQMSIPHHLSQEEALKRIQTLLTEMKKEHGDMVENLQENWNGNQGDFSFSVKGFDLSGKLTVMPSTIELDGKIPMSVSLFKGTIITMINKKAAELLA